MLVRSEMRSPRVRLNFLNTFLIYSQAKLFLNVHVRCLKASMDRGAASAASICVLIFFWPEIKTYVCVLVIP
jgi:hypothetical protein